MYSIRLKKKVSYTKFCAFIFLKYKQFSVQNKVSSKFTSKFIENNKLALKLPLKVKKFILSIKMF